MRDLNISVCPVQSFFCKNQQKQRRVLAVLHLFFFVSPLRVSRVVKGCRLCAVGLYRAILDFLTGETGDQSTTSCFYVDVAAQSSSTCGGDQG